MSDWRGLSGVVLAAQANFYRVRLDQPIRSQASQGIHDVLCTRRSRLKKLGQQVVVGDRVELSIAGERGAIESVAERRSFLPRPAIANVDQALVIFSLADPPLDPLQLSRFLVQSEASELSVRLCLNKCDRVSPEGQQDWQARLMRWGYTPLFLSARDGVGIDRLRQICRGHVSVMTGLSGVGKSTLLNLLIPGLNLATQAVSGRLHHGRHTTRHVELFPIEAQRDDVGWIADSPGFNQADLNRCSSGTLISYFPEARPWLGSCQFRDCLHQQEPGCQIRQREWERYPMYLSFLEEIVEREQAERETADQEVSLKPKSVAKHEGGVSPEISQVHIPRLESRYRHRSRRQHNQKAQQWMGDANEILEQGEEALEA